MKGDNHFIVFTVDTKKYFELVKRLKRKKI